jgi:hypothetical protein
MTERIIERIALAIFGNPGVLRVALDQALLLYGATDALCEVFDGNPQVLRAGFSTCQNTRCPAS